MDALYYALKCDGVAQKIDTTADAFVKSTKPPTSRSVNCAVRAGSLWQRTDSFTSADDTYEPITAVVRNSPTVVLRSCEQENLRLSCSLKDLHRLNGDVECQLLLAVNSEDERLQLIETDDGSQLKVGRRIWVAWKEQQHAKGCRSHCSPDIRVFIYGKICGSVRYVGHLSGRVGLWFGVELVTVSYCCLNF